MRLEIDIITVIFLAVIISFSNLIPSKFAIVFIRLILAKVWVDEFTRPQREIDIRHEFGLKVLLKELERK